MAEPTGNSWLSLHPLSKNLNNMNYNFSRRPKNNRIRGPVEEKPHIMNSKLRDKQPQTSAYDTVGRMKKSLEFPVLIITSTTQAKLVRYKINYQKKGTIVHSRDIPTQLPSLV